MKEQCISCPLQCELAQVKTTLATAITEAQARVGQAELGFEITHQMAEGERVQIGLEDLIAGDPDATTDDPATAVAKANRRASLFDASSASAKGLINALQHEGDGALRGRGPTSLEATTRLHQLLTESCPDPHKRRFASLGRRAGSIGLQRTCGSPAAPAAQRHLARVSQLFPGLTSQEEQ